MSAEFGKALKHWREQRRFSQLDLGLDANVSARHISFLETGRANPSRAMVIQLCDALEVPLKSRNQLLTAAGMAPGYADRGLSEAEMTPVRIAVERILKRHDPYPAIAIDRHWRAMHLNSSAGRLMAGMGIGTGDSLVEALIENEPMRAAIDNLDEVIAHAIARLRTESAHFGGDPVLDDLAARLAALESSAPDTPEALAPAFIPTRYRFGDAVLSLFSTFTQFGSAEDIALSEMRIEMMFPADEPTRMVLEALAAPT